MMATLVRLLLTLLAYLPLPWLHRFGALLGWCAYHVSPTFAVRLNENIHSSKTAEKYQVYHNFVKTAAYEIGKTAMELPIALCRTPTAIARLVRNCNGWEHVERSLASKHGILFIAPHLGSYDIAGRYLSVRLPCPLTAMYRPPKIKWVASVLNAGRARHNGKIAPANAWGVRRLIKALRAGEATIILPDQVPHSGEGVWAAFFGKFAYTMTLVSRLAQLDNVDVLLFTAERLPFGKGFSLWIEPLPQPFTGNLVEDARRLNAAMETLIRRYPTQYLWSYNRYKCPAGVQRPLHPPAP